jgi:cytochrome c biogenesis protein CcmG/thiol:disulfide interchange protein DsbE
MFYFFSADLQKRLRFTALLPLLMLAFLSLRSIAQSEEAPSFSLPGNAGPVSLAAHRGKVVYVDFWASWCGPCRKSFPWMNSLQQRYGAQGLVIVAINVDKKKEAAEAFLADFPPQFTIAFDPTGMTAESYRVWTMPSSYLIDRKGTLHSTHRGFFDADKGRIEGQIKQLLTQE